MNKRWGLVVIIAFICLGFRSLADNNVSIIANPESGNLPVTVSFSLESNTTLESYAWDFTSDGQVDSSSPAAAHTYTEEGTYLVTFNGMLQGQTIIATRFIIAKNPMSVSIVANPSSGQAPLAVQFTTAATGREPLTYSWDFQSDGTVDSLQQNPTFSFTTPGEYKIKLIVTDAGGTSMAKVLPLTITRFDSHLNLTSYFPTALNSGENQVTLLVTNDGSDPVKDITARIVAQGIQHLSSSSIAQLNPGDQDSLTIKINVLQADNLTAVAKIVDKSFPLSFSVNQAVKYNKDELQAQLNQLKIQLQQQEAIYYDKKSQGYLVAEVFDTIKSIQKQIQDAQEQILKAKYSDAKVNLDVTGAAVADLVTNLRQAKKQKVTIITWLKENAIAITAIVAAFGTISGILIKVKSHAVKVGQQAQKLTDDVRKKFPLRKSAVTEPTETKPDVQPEQSVVENAEVDPNSEIHKEK